MKEILISVRCLHCGHVSYVKSEQLISATLEPEIREAILKNTYFQGTCSCCGQPYAYFHPFLYVDQAHDFVIYGAIDETQSDRGKLEQYASRYAHSVIVTSPPALREQILILEDRLDPKKIRHLKTLLQKKKTQYHRFSYEGKEADCYWFSAEDENGVKTQLGIPICRERKKDL